MKRYTTEILAQTVQFIDGNNKNASSGPGVNGFQPQSQSNMQPGSSAQEMDSIGHNGVEDFSFNGLSNTSGNIMDKEYRISNGEHFTSDDIPF
ncbi:MAG: hypothetical protein HQK51_15125 [Oligoflexia bacterium]|nr:hypothetical protein [Oligoflexia bacterium]